MIVYRILHESYVPRSLVVSPEVGKNQKSRESFCREYNNDGIYNVAVEAQMSAKCLVVVFYVRIEAIRFIVTVVNDFFNYRKKTFFWLNVEQQWFPESVPFIRDDYILRVCT